MELLPREALQPERIVRPKSAKPVRIEELVGGGKPKARRSRNGCMSCKKLKIKCNEGKPSCEYCVHTKRICVYPQLVEKQQVVKPSPLSRSISGSSSSSGSPSSSSTSSSSVSEESIIKETLLRDDAVCKDLTNMYVKNLNSMQSMMNITRFEQKLLKFYLDFAGGFFSNNRSNEVSNVIQIDGPRLWRQSELMQSAIYACSTMYLWRFYNLNHITNVYLAGDDYLVIHTNNDPDCHSLFDITHRYISNTIQLLKTEMRMIDDITDSDTLGAMVISNVVVFTVVAVLPASPALLVSYYGLNNFFVDIFELSRGIMDIFDTKAEIMGHTRYESLIYREELKIIPPRGEKTMFPFVANLRSYMNNVVTSVDGNFAIYHEAITIIDHVCYRAVVMGYVLPILRGVVLLAQRNEFIGLLRSRDYISMKILYTLCCVISISGIKLFREMSIWDSYVEEFKVNSELMFGGFEDEFDALLYSQVHQRGEDKGRRKGKPFLDPVQLKLIGTGELLNSALSFM
jgi:hypothetical protein